MARATFQDEKPNVILHPDHIIKLILKWIISAKLQFKIVENKQFRDLVRAKLNPDYVLPDGVQLQQIYEDRFFSDPDVLFNDLTQVILN